MATLSTPNFSASASSPPRSQTSSPISPKSSTPAPLPSITTNLNHPPTSSNPPVTTNLSSTSASPSSPLEENDDDLTTLPFPPTLPRPSFLTPSFSPLSYLNTLYSSSSTSTRHQTLPDLRTELHTRSLSITTELLELVNANYTSFLSLGDELKGGEERVEDVRVGVLGFRRAVEEVRGRVKERREEVEGLCKELGTVRGMVEFGRGCLEWEGRVGGLEEKLCLGGGGMVSGGAGVGGSGSGGGGQAGVEGWVKRGTAGREDILDEEDEYAGWDDGSEDFKDEVLLSDTTTAEDDDREGFMSSSPAELEALAREYVRIENMADRLGGANEVPFVRKMEERMIRCRNTILLDLSTALKEARKVGGERGKRRVVRYLGVYRVLDAEQEAVRVLKEK